MFDIDSKKKIENLDRQKIIDRLYYIPEEINGALNRSKKIKVPTSWQKIKNIVIVGMGGSGIGGRVVKNISQNRSSIPIEIVNNYELPAFVDKDTLVIGVSFSGETEETIQSCDQALKQKAQLFIISKDKSILARFAKKNKVRHFAVDAPPPPRFALFSLVIPILIILDKLRIINNIEENILNTNQLIEKLISESRIESLAKENETKKIAKNIHIRIPITISSQNTSSVPKRFSEQINENAKKIAIEKTIPEMFHNFIEAISQNKSYHYILIKSSFDSPRIEKSWKILENFLDNKKIFYDIIPLQGKTLLSQIFFGIVFLDFVSYYTALLNKENPFYNINIDFYKKSLKK